MRLPSLPARLAQIDILKGLAILAVLGLHTVTSRQLRDWGGAFWLGQAVPVFVVLMGLNATGSLLTRAREGLRGVYTRGYLLSRLDRLYVPFLTVFLLSALIAAAQGSLTVRAILGGLVTGLLPYSGPGNYFITFAFEFALVFPALVVAFGRRPAATVVACFALALAGEVVVPHVTPIAQHPYVWDSSFLRLLPWVAVGMLLARLMLHGKPLPGWWLLAAAAAGVYLLAVTVDGDVLRLSLGGWGSLGQTSLAAFYSGFLVALGLRYLPVTSSGVVARGLSAVGRASYEIFLLQILWFSLVDATHLAMYPLSVAACAGSGLLLHRALQSVPRIATLAAARR